MSFLRLLLWVGTALLPGCGGDTTSQVIDPALGPDGGGAVREEAADADIVAPPDGPRPVADAAPPAADAPPPLPRGCIQGSYTPYFGNFHAHTGYSDGAKTPREAFQYARDVAGLDILVVTDHLEQLHLPLGDRWGACKAEAAAEQRPGAFVASCGFEYGSGFTPLASSTGHANVFFSADLFVAIQLDFRDFYATLTACADCVGQVNHPGSDKDEHFNHFEYHATADARLNLFEFNSDPAWELYFEALDAGWHLSPMLNQDNHDADWGTENDHRSGVLLDTLDLPALQAALRQRRTFSTEDKNAAITVIAAGACWMGSILAGTGVVDLVVEARDVDTADGFAAITLYGRGQQQLDDFDCQGQNPCLATFAVTAAQSPYFVARADQADNDRLIAAPIWLSP